MARAGLNVWAPESFRDALVQGIDQVQIDGDQELYILPQNQVFLFGNGGSATIADHIAVDLLKNGYTARALTNPGVMSMLANDYGWKEVFALQFATSLNANDWVIAISSSGRS